MHDWLGVKVVLFLRKLICQILYVVSKNLYRWGMNLAYDKKFFTDHQFSLVEAAKILRPSDRSIEHRGTSSLVL